MTVLIVVVALTGCATAAKNINAAYVSPEKFQGYDCAQLDQEISSVDGKVEELSSSQDSAAFKETVALLVCPMVLWPALYLVMDGDKSDELAQLKGEREALTSCAAEKQCTTLMAHLDADKHRKEATAQTVVQKHVKLDALGDGNES
jgi:hypothetical protein